MNTDKYGQQIFTEEDICNIYMQNPSIRLKKILTNSKIKFPDDLELTKLPNLIEYRSSNLTIENFDAEQSSNWFMPEEYKTLDIAKFVLDQCQTQEELQRAGEELLLFQERELFPLLRYLKFLVDTMRKNNIVWGVGRGSSVASFVLFLIGCHKINSLYYDIPISEFLK